MQMFLQISQVEKVSANAKGVVEETALSNSHAIHTYREQKDGNCGYPTPYTLSIQLNENMTLTDEMLNSLVLTTKQSRPTVYQSPEDLGCCK